MKPTPHNGIRPCSTTGTITAALILLFSFGIKATALAQRTNIYFTPYATRVTVPLNTTLSTAISNQVRLVNFGSNNAVTINLDVAGLPSGAGYTLTDTNGNDLLSTGQSTNLILTITTTNIAEGEYVFTLDASGTDSFGTFYTNYMPFVLQAGYMWTGSLNVSNNFASASSWVGGVVPGAADDVLLADSGAQTNLFSTGMPFTNITVSTDTTVGSIRFMQSVYTNAANTVTNTLYHMINIAPGKTLSVTGPLGFRILRDYLDENAYIPRTLGVAVRGGGGAKLMVSNDTANIAFLLDRQGSSLTPFLNMTNLDNFVAEVNRLGFAEYQLFPNYRAYNNGNDDTNFITAIYTGRPRQLLANVYLARTNIIKALYVDPSNYTDQTTRGYGLSFLNNETQGNGSSTVVAFFLGVTNAIFADGVCFVGANSASSTTAANGNTQFATNNGFALFRGVTGGRMSMFAVSDDGGTNAGTSNVKGTVNFDRLGGTVDILADRLYMSRDRSIINSNQTPNVQSDLTIGKGIVDVNSAILGFQEHNDKIDWTTLYSASPYLGYCQGRLFITNGGTFRVNGTLTLGYTADTNPVGSAQQFNTYGQVTVASGSTLMVSNIVEDGGSNWYLNPNQRQNKVTLLSGSTLIVSNSVGAAPGLPLDTLSMSAATLTLFVNAAQTNVYVNKLTTPGLTPTTIKIASLAGVTSFPAEVPLISYAPGTYSAPSLVADVSALGTNYHGYILNNPSGNTIDVAITTNVAVSLVWNGSATGSWNNTNSPDWTGPTNVFGAGDFVTFNDSSANTNVLVVGTVIPGQATNTPGITVSNYLGAYVFSGGSIAGAGTILKQGTNNLEMDAAAQGAINITAGSVTGTGGLGAATVSSNTTLVFGGGIVGGVTSTGAVSMVSGGTVFGPILVGGGTFTNAGTIDTSSSGVVNITGGAAGVNNGIISVNGGASTLDVASTFANFGTVNDNVNQFNVSGTLSGNGTFFDPQSTGTFANSPPGRVVVNGGGMVAPGGIGNTIGTLTIDSRFDLNEAAGNPGVLLIKVDWSDPQVNDQLNLDRWNNMYGMLWMTNVNPSAGGFTNGQTYLVAKNNQVIAGGFVQDVPFSQPMMWPPIPAPGLAWQLDGIRSNGIIAITNQLVWRGNVSGNWNTNDANWAGGAVYADGYGVLFDDSALGGNTNINIGQLIEPATNPNDTNNMIVSPGIMVSNSLVQYTFSGTNSIAGRANFYKSGPGTATILGTNNTFSGNTTIDGGILAVQALANWANPSSIGQGSWTATNLVQLRNTSTSAGNQIPLTFANGATLQYLGTNNSGTDRNILLQRGGGAIDVPTNKTVVQLTGTINGPGSLSKTGVGILSLNNTGNPFAGGTIVNAGTLRLIGPSAGAGTIVLAQPGSALELSNSVQAVFTLTNAVSFSNGTLILVNTNALVSGAWSGSGSVTISNVSQLVINTALTNVSANISAAGSSGLFQFNNATNRNNCLGSSTSSFDLGTGNARLVNLNGGGLIYDLGGLAGGGGTALSGRNSNTVAWAAASTYRIGALGASTTFAGTISNGLDSVTIIKEGAGALTLSGNNSYSGGTIVSNGTLFVNNAAGSGTGTGTVTVVSGTLSGSGTIWGSINIQASGTLTPGATAGSLGTLTTTNSATLAGTTLLRLNRSTSPSNDLVSASSFIANGALIVTNVGPNLHNGDKFKLFSSAVSGFSSVLLPASDPSNTSAYTWVNNLNVDGTIQLQSGGAVNVNTNPTTMTVAFAAGTLTLGWPSDHTGWQLQSNSVSLLSTNTWFPVSGSTGTNQQSIPVDASYLNVFYRLVYPPAP